MELQPDDGLSRRARERALKRHAFETIRATYDTTAELEQELARRRDGIAGDGTGFYQTFVEEAVKPAMERAVAARPEEERDEIRTALERHAEPVLQAAAMIEHDQSVRHFLSETDRIAGHMIGDLELDRESFWQVRGQLQALLDAAPVPQVIKPFKADELDRTLARHLFDLMLAEDRAGLIDGALGWTRSGRNGTPDPRFDFLSEAERRGLHEKAVGEAEEQD
jgi:hypothetical protein